MTAVAALTRLIRREALNRTESHALFEQIMDGQIDPAMIGAIAAALASKGESVDELVGAALAMRARMTVVQTPPGVHAIDTCGTGGDGKPTFNVSTAVAIVAAAAGAAVAKHGNRSNARPSGAAEVVAALGIAPEADVPTLERCLRECRVAFLFAPHLHPAMKHAGPVRRALGVRTIFNLVGPLTNPARVRRQLMGVSRPEHVDLITHVLAELGSERAMVVHGLDGLCDIGLSAPTRIGRWDGQRVSMEEFDPRSVGLPPRRLEEVFIGSPAESAARILDVLAGAPGAPREIVAINAAAALWVAGLAIDWSSGVHAAFNAIDSGAAAATLTNWRALAPLTTGAAS